MTRWASGLLIAAVIVAFAGLALATADPDLVGAPSATTGTTQPTGPWSDVPLAEGTTGVLQTSTGIVVPIAGIQADGSFLVQTPCDGRTTVAAAGSTVLHGANIVLDPGHGGDEPGAVGPNGLVEKDLNLAVAHRTADLLRQLGATVVLTRQQDERVTLATRAGIAVALKPTAFVSIHHNAAADGPSTGPGTEVYYQLASPDSQRLAGLLVEEIRAALSQYQGVPWESDADNGAKGRVSSITGEDYYGVLRRAAGVTSVLSEAGYLSNPAEAELFAREDVQQAEAQAITNALTRYLDTTQAPQAQAYSTQPPATGGGGSGGGGPDGCVDPPLA